MQTKGQSKGNIKEHDKDRLTTRQNAQNLFHKMIGETLLCRTTLKNTYDYIHVYTWIRT